MLGRGAHLKQVFQDGRFLLSSLKQAAKVHLRAVPPQQPTMRLNKHSFYPLKPQSSRFGVKQFRASSYRGEGRTKSLGEVHITVRCKMGGLFGLAVYIC